MKVKFNLRFLAVMLCGIFATLSAMAQDITVKGTVNDAFGDPVMGATVLQVGTTNGCVTDLDGNFSLKAPEGAILRFSFIGYRSQEHPAAANMTVTLEEDSELLEDVVVIGYGTAKKTDMTGSVTAIKPDDMSKGITTSMQDMLNGKAAGVSVIGDGTPGGGATIRIRGGSSLSASNDPLYVIDGLAMDNNGVQGLSNPLAMINPNDIESMTILKDASATAIYGSRASNGVIIVTTKKGRKGMKPQVSYNLSGTVSAARDTYKVLSGDEYRAAAQAAGVSASALSELGNANTDWQDEVFRKAVSTDHNISLAGAYKNFPYRVSVGYSVQNGIIKESQSQKLTASLNISPSFLDDHLKFNLNAKYLNGKDNYTGNSSVVGAAIAADPTQGVYNPASEATGGFWQTLISDGSLASWTTPVTNTNTPQNPVAYIKNRSDKAKSSSVIGDLSVDYKIHGFEDLTVHASVSGDYSEGRQTTKNSPYSYDNNYYGYQGISQSYKYNIQGNAYIQYNHDFEKQHLDVMVGAEQQHFHRETFSEGGGPWKGTAYVEDPANWYSPSNRTETKHTYRNSLVSYFGRANYSFLDRYMLTATMRFDGSSRFASGNKWGQFPAFAAVWKVNEESFLNDVDWLSDLKIRASYGITGQQNIGNDFYYAPRYVVSDQYGQYWLGQDPYYTSRPEVFNEDLKWEKTYTKNIGLDFGVLDGRVTMAADYYYRETKDLISTVSVASGTNFGNYLTKNIGSLVNKGIEFSIDARAIQKKNFTWQVGYNITWNDNEITKLADGADFFLTGNSIGAGLSNQVQVNKVGYPANSFYIYQQVYDEAGKPLEGVFVDRNGDGTINADDKYVYKKPAGDVLMALTNKFIYKNWDLSFTWRASLNNYLYYDFLSNKANVSASGFYSNSAFSNVSKEALELGFQGKTDYYMSDYFVRNASFLRCDNINLGYSFEQLFKCGSYKGISGRIYFTVQNPIVITAYDGLDPEISTGVDSSVYPRPISYQLGLSLNF